MCPQIRVNMWQEIIFPLLIKVLQKKCIGWRFASDLGAEANETLGIGQVSDFLMRVKSGRFPSIEKDMKLALSHCGSLLLDPSSLCQVDSPLVNLASFYELCLTNLTSHEVISQSCSPSTYQDSYSTQRYHAQTSPQQAKSSERIRAHTVWWVFWIQICIFHLMHSPVELVFPAILPFPGGTTLLCK